MIWETVLGNATASGLIATLFGGLAGWISSLHLYNKERKASSADDVERLLDDLKIEATAYWKRAGQDPAREEALSALCIRCIDRLQRHNKRHRASQNQEQLEMSCADLMIDVTGGAFATLHRAADTSRVARITTRIDQLLSLLEP